MGSEFVEISQGIVKVGRKVNLIGVVIDFSIPRMSSRTGTDWYCNLHIIDPSFGRPGLLVTFFAQNSTNLPHIESRGDIIQLRRVWMQNYNGKVNAVFYKDSASFALFKGKDGQDALHYQVSSRFYPSHPKKIIRLREWLRSFEVHQDSVDFKLLRDIKAGEDVNLICKVLHVCNVAEHVQMVFIWDGTDAPPTSFHTKLENGEDKPLPLQLEALPLSRDLLCTFPAVGTILRVVFNIGNEKYDLSIHIGKWFKFINLFCEVYKGFWSGMLWKSTKLIHLLEDDHNLQECQRLHKARTYSNDGQIPSCTFSWPSCITEVENSELLTVTLMQALTSSKVTAIFRCVLRIVEFHPWRAKDFCSPEGTYRVRLTLEDPTARIHAFVYDEDGETFFGGYPPFDELERKRNKLLGVGESDDGKDAPINPPFIQCYLKSYYLNKSDGWGSRQYRIFATKVVVNKPS